jgi:hypothetical protein
MLPPYIYQNPHAFAYDVPGITKQHQAAWRNRSGVQLIFDCRTIRRDIFPTAHHVWHYLWR